ncbi:NAD(P)/FAD-dependent oxidoreductase [Streptomyces sp. MNU89]|uniref:NAD(P)/FAD-dependent oxidoreductase n=1 Tax=Streptomyces sp. MNU89 TaxID=2560025 RepID=UPI001E2ED588|nr:FAD-dependent oxidoreductase [Streptomyces sp. MNU89]MCC9742056.1 FAD-dependent oxidoreductase [Streptomyces sp. MNU89]
MSEDRRTAERVVIVGAGMAGARTAVALREEGWPGAITLLGAESHPPYDRPPLSKAVLQGGHGGDAAAGTEGGASAGAATGPAGATSLGIDFAALDVELLLGHPANALRAADRLVVAGDTVLPYDHLVIATGADPVGLPGSETSPGVHVLRTLDDAERLRPVLAAGRRIVIVGAGWIGAELTTAAREAGCPVTVVEATGRPLADALPAEVTAPMAGWYEEAGARLLTGTRVAAVESGGVLLGDGSRLRADAVVVGIGARPATGWLAGSGVELGADGSVRADERLSTSLPDVYAVGDCASFPSARYGERLLIHHWDNAFRGPVTVAARIARCAEETPVYDPVPYFWSEQFGRFLQYAGHHSGGERLLWRGDPAGTSWSVCWLRDGVLTALLAVGRPRDLAQGRRLIERAARLDPERAADPSVPLKSAAV